ncbi:Gfo/Idh/MocA family protein [Echinimonas agarilytica]|uniref:Gfo/Idh/MocA family oxidoreductase n=1 Tax=Echinimonas agarilytica TaxID=1215918 RepID=A0AA41W559_9GAMM|nr:Gfo/Idh/MocA family oxidoreductase [Echinimonas agarilytica]MCM2679065.1 Gfo/Idh/MocA family oxidoreductase [Echinimonas agarilytica]
MIRFAIIGTNFITERLLDASKHVAQFKLTTVYSRHQHTATEFAAKHQAEYTYTNFNALCQSPHFDAVYIASPTSFHAPQAIALMNAGKHVLVEKPAASNAIEFQAMATTAAENNVTLMEAMMPTMTPAFTKIKEFLPQIGPIRQFISQYCQYSSRYDKFKQGERPNAFNPEFSNGALMDIGIYPLASAVHLLGVPDDIVAKGTLLETGVDGCGQLLLQYQHCQASIIYSKVNDGSHLTEILGENGRIEVDFIAQPRAIRFAHRNEEMVQLDVGTLKPTMSYELTHFIALILKRHNESTINTWQRSETTLRLIDQSRKQLGVHYPADV